MIDQVGSGTKLRISGPINHITRAYQDAQALGLLVQNCRTDDGRGSFTAVLTKDLSWGQFQRLVHLLGSVDIRYAAEHGAAASLTTATP